MNARGMLLAYHDRSDGGLIVTVAEMMFASRLGVSLSLGGSRDEMLRQLFNEELGAVVQVEKSKLAQVQMVLDRFDVSASAIGRVESDAVLTVRSDDEVELRMSRARMQREWSEMSYRIQSLRDNPATALQEFDRILDDKDPGLHALLTFDPSDDPTTGIRSASQTEGCDSSRAGRKQPV